MGWLFQVGKVMGLPTVIDLFAGAGGVSTGLKRAGYDVVAAVENDRFAARSFAANHPEVRLYQRDIRTLDPRDILRDVGIENGGIDVVTACPPCQGFSTLGKLQRDDARNDLVLDVWRFVRELRPAVVMLENVPGLAGDDRLTALLRRMRAVGYSAREWVVDANDFGVPQRRRRLIVIGVLDARKHAISLPMTLHELVPVRSGLTAGSVFQALEKIDLSRDPLHKPRNHTSAVRARIMAVPVGGTRFDLPIEHQLPCHRRMANRSASGAYGRIRLGEPAPTMTTRCASASCGAFVHPTEHRAISLREAAMIQTFPVNYKFAGHRADIERQIGNALPSALAESLGVGIGRLLEARGRSWSAQVEALR